MPIDTMQSVCTIQDNNNIERILTREQNTTRTKRLANLDLGMKQVQEVQKQDGQTVGFMHHTCTLNIFQSKYCII